MKRIWKYLFVFVIASTVIQPHCIAQNLVSNPSFEDTVTCPSNLSQVDRAVGWSSYKGTPDYFNSCSPISGFVSEPSNNFGYQYPKSGNAYMGLHTLTGNTREYIGVQLTQPLILGQKYYASFYTNKADKTGYRIAINKLGIRLTTMPFSASNPVPVDNFAQLYSDSIITDTLNWFKIEGSFIADSAYNYLSIGNFFTDSLTSRIKLDSVSSFAYYYIDDVFIGEDTGEGIEENDLMSSIRIFPNPAHNWIVIEGISISRLSFFDLLGKLYFSTIGAPSSTVRINTADFNKGIYFLKIQTATKIINQKVIIQ